MSEKHCIESGIDDQQVIQLLEENIYEYNSAKTNKYDGHFFSKIMRNENKDIIAGIAGWTWAGVCEITHLWIDEKLRKNGLGKMLLAAAEEEAKSKSCHTVMVKTYSFQAPEFYEKYGYETKYILNDFPEESNYYILTKKFG